MARTLELDVGLMCQAYRESIADVCEVIQMLREESTSLDWTRKQINADPWGSKKCEIHHIWGRGRTVQKHWFCSLAKLWAVSHGYDRVSPPALELCSLKAKMLRHECDIRTDEVFQRDPDERPESRRHWHYEAMSAACGSPTLAGRIEGILLPKVTGTHWESIAIELLDYCGKKP